MNPDTSWTCVNCGMPNFSSTLFDTSTCSSTISSTASNEEDQNIEPPLHTSSPKRGHAKPKKDNLTLLVINFQSIKNKSLELGNVLDMTDPDIVMGTETWLTGDYHSSEYFPPIYEVIRKDRRDGYGGVLLAIKRNLTFDQIQISQNIEAVAARISIAKNRFLSVASVYRPPSSDIDNMNMICESITEIQNKHRNDILWIGGDINLPDIDWLTSAVTGWQHTIDMNNKFIETTQDCGLEQQVKSPTRGDKILDLFLTNRPTLTTRCTCIPGIGDHDIVYVDALLRPKRPKPPRRKIYIWKRADLDQMRTKATSIHGEITRAGAWNNVEEIWKIIKETLLKIMDAHVPSKMSSTRYNQPWVNTEVKRTSRKKKKLYIKARRTGCPLDWDRYQRYKKEAKKTHRTAYKEFMHSLMDPETENATKKFWSYVNSRKCDSSGVAPLKSENGQLQSESEQKANILNEQFSSVFCKDEDTQNIRDKGHSNFPGMPAVQITPQGVVKLLTGLKPHKATGPDQIPTMLLKSLAAELTPTLTSFFQTSLDQGTLPQDWKSANVVPIFKKGDKSKAENYRPVSLTSILCKLLEHILASSIMKHLDKHNILTDAQHGFRKRRSCESQLIITTEDLARNIDNKKQTDVILLDFSKAFDKVPHQRLLYKTNYYGIRGNHLQWIRSFLEGRTQRVVLDNVYSGLATVDSGVPQGSVLGPLLFSLYINDLPDVIRHGSTVRLFADDCVLYRTVDTQEDAAALQADLDHLQTWEKDWLMKFHPSKCQVIHVTNKRQIIKNVYKIHEEALESTDSAKYLGVSIHKGLSWNTHIDNTVNKANKILAFVRRNTYQCNRKTKEQCYKTLIRPVLEYGSVIWDPHTKSYTNKIEAIQRRAARYVTGDHKRTSSVTAMIEDLKWPTLEERRAQAKVAMMYRIMNDLVDIPKQHLIPAGHVGTRGHTRN